MARDHAALEDTVDRVKELVDELTADAADGIDVDLSAVVDRLRVAIEPE